MRFTLELDIPEESVEKYVEMLQILEQVMADKSHLRYIGIPKVSGVKWRLLGGEETYKRVNGNQLIVRVSPDLAIIKYDE